MAIAKRSTGDAGARAALHGWPSELARHSRVASGEHRVITLGIELDALLRVLRDRRFQERVIVGVIGLAALAALARESQARFLARLADWDNGQYGRYQRGHEARP